MIRFGARYRYRRNYPNAAGGPYLRLGMLIGLLVLVCLLMRQASDPANYQWLTQLERGRQNVAPPTAPQAVGPPINGGKSAATNGATDSAKQTASDERTGSQPLAVAAAERAWEHLTGDADFRALWHDAWDYVLGGLNPEDTNLLGDALLGLRHAQPPPASWAISLPPVLDQMDAALERYLQTAQSTLTVQDESQREAWQNRFNQLAQSARQIVMAVLKAYVTQDQPDLDSNRRAWLDVWQAALDRKLLEHVRDATFFSNHETALWFRCWEESALPPSPNEPPLVLLVNDLVSAPQRYRGVRVQLEGEVRLVRQVPAPANPLNIKQYYVLWMRTTGSSQPVAGYARQLPDGIRVSDSGAETESTPIPVTVNGIFFKLMSYRSARGVDVAPVLVISDVRVLHLTVTPLPMTERLPLGWIVLASALLALVVVYAVWRYSGRSGRPTRTGQLEQPQRTISDNGTAEAVS